MLPGFIDSRNRVTSSMNDNNRIYLQGVGPHDPPFPPIIPKMPDTSIQEEIRCSNCCSMCMLSGQIICDIDMEREHANCMTMQKGSTEFERCIRNSINNYTSCHNLQHNICSSRRGCNCVCDYGSWY